MYKIFIILALFVSGLWAQEEVSLDALQAERVRLLAVQDSLQAERVRLAGEMDALSGLVDSLKQRTGASTATGALEQALRQTLDLSGRLEALDRALEGVQAGLQALRGRLREAYDREIGALIERLSRGPAPQLIGRLQALQQAREALAGQATSERGMGEAEEGLVIREDDGPDEIRQKAELMEDLAARLRAEAEASARRLKRLEEERRLRTRVSALAGEMGLFDETVAEGRTLAPGSGARGPEAEGGAGAQAPAFDAERVSGATEGLAPAGVVAGREASRPGGEALPAGTGSGDLAQEIARLKRQQADLLAREDALRRRAAAFREQLEAMLEAQR